VLKIQQPISQVMATGTSLMSPPFSLRSTQAVHNEIRTLD